MVVVLVVAAAGDATVLSARMDAVGVSKVGELFSFFCAPGEVNLNAMDKKKDPPPVTTW